VTIDGQQVGHVGQVASMYVGFVSVEAQPKEHLST